MGPSAGVPALALRPDGRWRGSTPPGDPSLDRGSGRATAAPPVGSHSTGRRGRPPHSCFRNVRTWSCRRSLQAAESFDNRRARTRTVADAAPPVRSASTDNNFRRSGQTRRGRPRRRASPCFCLAAGPAGGCGPLVERAPFPVRPDSVRAADLLGPVSTGWSSTRDSERPVAGATVAASWAFERGIGLQAPLGAREVVVETGPTDATFPGASTTCRRGVGARATVHPDRLPPRARRLAQRSAVPGRRARGGTSASAAGAVRLERWQPSYGPRRSPRVRGRRRAGSARPPPGSCSRRRSSSKGSGRGGAGAVPASRSRPPPRRRSTSSRLLSDDEIRGVTGYVGKFEDGKLTDLPTTEFYDSRHFKAVGKPESYDVGLRVWRLGRRGRRGPVWQADGDPPGGAHHRRGRRRRVPRPGGRDRRRWSTWCASEAWSSR